MVKQFLIELCEKQIVFPFYLKYSENLLREVMLYDKIILEYRAHRDSLVFIEYRICYEKIMGIQVMVYKSKSTFKLALLGKTC